ncbi:MAG: hypothetical protein IIU06_02805 [Erysipelotrichales bacterium]|nr:hypothetical protein [Erysipelotrichales bacterium]
MYDSRKTTFRLFVLAEVLVLAAAVLFGNIKYEVSDDFLMEALLSGAFNGAPDYRILFSNPILGWILTLFYKFAPQISWYFICHLVTAFFSYLCVAYIAAKTLPRGKAFCVVAAITFFTVQDVYLLPQFTKIAAFAVMTGGSLFLCGILMPECRRGMIPGALVLIAGYLIRHQTIYIALPFLGLFLFERILSSSHKGKTVLRLLAGIGVLTAIVLAVFFAGRTINRSDPAHAEYYQWNVVRARISDYPKPEYSKCADKFEAIGISENDYELICKWAFTDYDYFTIEKMREVSAVLEDYRAAHPRTAYEMFRSVWSRRAMFYPGALCSIFFGIFFMIYHPKKWWLPIMAAGGIAAYFLYFAYTGREVYRVECACYFYSSVMLACECCTEEGDVIPGPLRIPAMILAVCLCLAHGYVYIPEAGWKNKTAEQMQEDIKEMYHYSWKYDVKKYKNTVAYGVPYREFFAEVNKHPENTYFMDFDTTIQSVYYQFSPLQSADDVWPENLVYLGGVTYHHPGMDLVINKRGFEDWDEALLSGDTVFLVCDGEIGIYETYFREHYSNTFHAERVKTLDGLDIYRIAP